MKTNAQHHIQKDLELRPGLNKVTFQSAGSTLVGNLFLPPSYPSGTRLPGLVVAGSWTTVKEQMAGHYARRLAAEGFATLAFDFRYYGESEGEPRQWENPTAKVQDLKNAASFLQSLPGVDPEAIGALGVCASAGYLAHTVAEDDRFKAFATVAAWMQTPEAAQMFYGGEAGVQHRIDAADAAQQAFEQGEVRTVPAYAPNNGEAAMFFEVDYYGDPERGAIASWANNFAVQSWRGWLTFDALEAAPRITTPTLLIHSDDAALPDFVRQFHEALPGTKALHWSQGTQTDFYDQEPQVSEAVGVAAAWFRQHLGTTSEDNQASTGTAHETAVAEGITRMLHAIDALDRDGVRAAFADSVRTDYTSLFGGEAQVQPVDDLLAGWWSLLPGFDATQHLTGPFVVNINDTHAAARCAVTGTHRLGDQSWVVGGHYQIDLIRQADNWLIESLTLETAFVDGDSSLPEQALERVAGGNGRTTT